MFTTKIKNPCKIFKRERNLSKEPYNNINLNNLVWSVYPGGYFSLDLSYRQELGKNVFPDRPPARSLRFYLIFCPLSVAHKFTIFVFCYVCSSVVFWTCFLLHNGSCGVLCRWCIKKGRTCGYCSTAGDGSGTAASTRERRSATPQRPQQSFERFSRARAAMTGTTKTGL